MLQNIPKIADENGFSFQKIAHSFLNLNRKAFLRNIEV